MAVPQERNPVEIGLFPLGLVLVPGESIPLHIFEDRYKELIDLCIDRSDVFGIVLTDDEELRSVGTTARIAEVATRYPDGRLDIVVTGVDRFRVIEVSPSKESFLKARVQILNDDADEVPLEGNVEGCVAAYRELADEVGVDTVSLDMSGDVSFQIIATVDLGPEIKQEFLELTSEQERVQRLAIALHAARDAVARRNAIAERAAGNGHIRFG
ncbi:MAG: LON peptidase substrate-binding domain-containing protein [Actinomycetota bacterium]|nr:LON peptidase substrate-binding domain-containing protein [Actinomycetota bacterium]